MSNGSGGNNCGAVAKVGEIVYLFKAPEYHLGPLGSVPAAEYAGRIALAQENKITWPGGEVTPDPIRVFPELADRDLYTDGERYGFAVALAPDADGASFMDMSNIPEQDVLIASEDSMLTVGVANRYAGPKATLPEAA